MKRRDFIALAGAALACSVGFGIAIAMGPATVGTLGYHGRLDYTAIGNVVNPARAHAGACFNRRRLTREAST